MSSCYITISYHIISNLLFSCLFCWLVLDCIQFDSIEFDWIWFIMLYSIVSHINEWFVRLFVCLFVCLFICMNKFLFRFLFCSPLFSYLFSDERLAHWHDHLWTHTYIWIYVPSYDWHILLQKTVSEESYSSDCIISYLI